MPRIAISLEMCVCALYLLCAHQFDILRNMILTSVEDKIKKKTKQNKRATCVRQNESRRY